MKSVIKFDLSYDSDQYV